MNKYHDKCILCNSDRLSDLQGYERHEMAVCNQCGFIFMYRIPTIAELTEHYKTYSYTGSPGDSTLISFNKLLDYFEIFRENNNILDFGCGRGWFLDEAKKRGWNVYGTEFSTEAIDLCITKGIVMKQGDLLENDFGGVRFDIVFCSEVIEHVNDPILQLQSIFRVLRPGGGLYLTTPNFNCYLRYQFGPDFNIIEYPEHLCYFTRKSMHFAMRKAGFVKKSLRTTGISLSRAAGSQNPGVLQSGIKERDENLRQRMNSSRFMQLVKEMANSTLSVTGLGFTIKAMYLKPR
jgi:2-polyprenyl-3-methyl-5-hydroxy-6-metoxy-1,4-benzoquinol methylase